MPSIPAARSRESDDEATCLLVAAMDFDRDVLDAEIFGDQRLVVVGRLGIVGDDGKRGGMDARPDRPHVEIGEPVVALQFDGLAHSFADLGPSGAVEQHVAGIAHQAERPDQDHDRTHQTHDGVEPDLSPQGTRQQRDDGQHRRRGIGHHMDIGGAEVVVVVTTMAGCMIVLMLAAVIVPVVMVAGALQDQGAGQVHDEADDRDDERPAELDRTGRGEAQDAFPGHRGDRDEQQEGAGEAAQGRNLAGAERVACVARLAPHPDIGEHADGERQGVGTHVQPVGQQRH